MLRVLLEYLFAYMRVSARACTSVRVCFGWGLAMGEIGRARTKSKTKFVRLKHELNQNDQKRIFMNRNVIGYNLLYTKRPQIGSDTFLKQ